MLHGLQSDTRPGITMLQDKGCPFHWPDSGSSSLQLSQHRDTMVRADDLFGYQEIEKDHHFPIPKDRALPVNSCLELSIQ